MFRLTLLDQFHELDGQGDLYANKIVAQRYGIHHSILSKWHSEEDKLRLELRTKHFQSGKYKDATTLANTKMARRMQLGGGRSSLFPLAEVHTFEELKTARAKGYCFMEDRPSPEC